MKLSEIAEKINGVLDGDGAVEIRGVAAIDRATSSEISFVANPKYASTAAATKAAAVIVSEDWSADCPVALIRVKNPDAAFAAAAQLFYTPVPAPLPGVHPSAIVADDVLLGAGVSIGPHCVIERGVRIGANTVISAQCYIGHQSRIGSDCFFYPQVSLREEVQIGSRVILHNGTVVGSDGFGYSVGKDGVRTKIPQIGTVVIEDDVELGANVCVDRARFGQTRIGKGTKIDNLVQIAHNVVIGEHSVMCGQSGTSGSTTIGSRVILAGQAGLAGHLKVHDGAIVGAQAGVMNDIEANAFVIGSPAMPHMKFKKSVANTLLLPKLKERVVALEKKVRQLEG
jgi:UDP-3-O-[3-hydroxymyristoyl] glucosamine N-acyltransferase